MNRSTVRRGVDSLRPLFLVALLSLSPGVLAAGRPLTPLENNSFALAGHGGRFVAAWVDEDDRAHAAVLTADVTIHEEIISGPSTSVLDVSSNGVEYLVLHRFETELFATRFDAQGRMAGLSTLLSSDPWIADADAEWIDDRWVVVWGGSSLRRALISPSGLVSEASEIPLAIPVRSDRSVAYVHSFALARTGRDLLLAFTVDYKLPCPIMCPGTRTGFKLFAARLDAAGGPIGARPLHLGHSFNNVAVAANDTTAVVLSDELQIVLDLSSMRVRTKDAVIDWPSASDVTWDGREFVVALRYEGIDWRVATHRFDHDGARTGEPRGLATGPLFYPVPPSIAANLHGDVLIGITEQESSGVMRATVYDEDDLEPLPPPPGPPVNVRHEVLSPDGFFFELRWDPPVSGGPVELYAVEMLFTGDQEPYTRVLPASARSFEVFGARHVRVRAFNAGGVSALPPRPRAARK